MTGIIVRSHSRDHFVRIGDEVIRCGMRGKLRSGGRLLTGDRVVVTRLPDGTGVIEDVLERKTVLIRPSVANVDLAVIVMSVCEPDWQGQTVDRLAAAAAAADLDIVICANKVDLDLAGVSGDLLSVYERIGYGVVATSAAESSGLERLQQLMLGKIAVLCGVSGVGKSSLLNALWPGLKLQTGEVSSRGSGRHTTRRAEMLTPERDIVVVDTPGFSSVEPIGVSERELAELFPEFFDIDPCEFNDCLHDREHDCAIKDAVTEGKIGRERYESYVAMLREIREREARKY